MVVSETLLTFSVIIIGLYLDLVEGLGRYVIEQQKHKNSNASNDDLGDTEEDKITSTNSEQYSLTSVSGHRVPITGPRQLQKQQFDSTNVRIETVLVMSILGGAFVCLMLMQVWRQISAFKKRRLRNNNSQIVESIKNQSGATPWNREQIQFVSAELVGDACGDLQDCDCELKASVHRQGYEKVACVTTAISEDVDDALFDSLMIPESYPHHHRPEVVHVNMNIVQVVHHCGEPDASKCVQDGCGKTSHHNKRKTYCSEKKDKNPNKNCSSSIIPLRYKEGYQNTIIDMDDLQTVNTVIWDDNSKAKKELENNRASPSNTSRKSCSGKSLISTCESTSDSDRYDTVVNLQNLKHSDTAALLVKDGKSK